MDKTRTQTPNKEEEKEKVITTPLSSPHVVSLSNKQEYSPMIPSISNSKKKKKKTMTNNKWKLSMMNKASHSLSPAFSSPKIKKKKNKKRAREETSPNPTKEYKKKKKKLTVKGVYPTNLNTNFLNTEEEETEKKTLLIQDESRIDMDTNVLDDTEEANKKLPVDGGSPTETEINKEEKDKKTLLIQEESPIDMDTNVLLDLEDEEVIEKKDKLVGDGGIPEEEEEEEEEEETENTLIHEENPTEMDTNVFEKKDKGLVGDGSSPKDLNNIQVLEEEEETDTTLTEKESSKESNLFKRVWSQADEILLLQAFKDFDTNPFVELSRFHESVKPLISFEATTLQLQSKLKKLRKKFMKKSKKDVVTFAKNQDHERKCFQMSMDIWGSKVMAEKEEEENWFEKSVLLKAIVCSGLTQEAVIQRWSLVPAARKRQIKEKLVALQIQSCLRHTELVTEATTAIIQATI
ncbi:unnamed protein product [Cochlearia groenlandica]